jgi:predicted nuclease with TOPRIM domain
MQTEPTPVVVKPKPNILNILLVVGLVIASLAVIALGYLDFSTNNQIKAVQADHATLQGKYDSLMQEKNGLTSDLDSTRAELEQATADLEAARQKLATSQADLAKAQEEQTSLQGKVEKTLKYLDVAIGYWVDDVSTTSLNKRVEAVDDPDLTRKFDRWRDNKTVDRWFSWITYIFVATADLLTVR